MNRVAHGVVYGKTIQLSENLDIADGQEVEVVVRSLKPRRPWGEGIRASAGALADEWTEEDDRILEEIHLDRKRAIR